MKKTYTTPVAKCIATTTQPILEGSEDERFKVRGFSSSTTTTLGDDDEE